MRYRTASSGTSLVQRELPPEQWQEGVVIGQNGVNGVVIGQTTTFSYYYNAKSLQKAGIAFELV